jgi:heptosyltransferase-2
LGQLDRIFGDFGLKVLKGFVIEKDVDVGDVDHDSIKKILVVLRHQMGDLITATPMLRSLKAAYAGSKLILVTKHSTRYKEIFTGMNSIADEVLEYEYGFENYVNLVKELREEKIDLAVVPSTVVYSSTNHLIAYYSHAKIRAGVKSMDYDDNKVSYLLNVKNDFTWSKNRTHQIEKNLDIIRQLGIAARFNRVEIYINDAQKSYALSLLKESSFSEGPIICFHPGAAKEGNVWPAAKFAELANMLAGRFSSKIIISEGPLDRKFADEMIRILKESYGIENVLRHKGLLMNNLALIDQSDLFVTNDTGVMHLASGLQTPVIALFGPTKAYLWGPLGDNKISIQAASSKLQDLDASDVFSHCVPLLEQKLSLK